MKAIIFSDSHRRFNPMYEAVEREGGIDYIIHAGDVVEDAEELAVAYPRKSVIYVRGNNDFWHRDVPDDRFFTLDGVKIFLTHGHNYGVKYSAAKVKQHAVQLGADICIFGHTHSAVCDWARGFCLFNPGTPSDSYGILETNGGKFDIRLVQNDR